MYLDLADVTCIAHSLDNVGKRIQTPMLWAFLQLWASLFAHRLAAKIILHEVTGDSIKSYCATRWWSWWEMIEQLHSWFADVP